MNTVSWEKLPNELKLEIFSKIVPLESDTIISGLADAALVSKEWNVLAKEAKLRWVNQDAISLSTYKWKKATELSLFVQKSANFKGFDQISDKFIKKIAQLSPLLTHLILTSFKIKKLPILSLTHLTHLGLLCPKLKDESLSEALSKFENLQYLDLIQCGKLGTKTISSLQHLPNLTYLKLQKFKVDGVVLAKSLLYTKKIKSLFLMWVNQPEEGISKAMAQWSDLTHLAMMCSNFHGQSFLDELAKRTQLVYLNLCGLTEIDSDKLGRTLSQLILLNNLSLYGTGEGDGTPVAKGLKKLINLESLSLLNIEKIPQLELAKCISELNLSSFQLRFYSQCGPHLCDAIATLSRLKYLKIASCYGINSKSFEDMLSQLTCLRTLELWYCEDLEGEDWLASLIKMQNLETLLLKGLQCINFDNLKTLIEKLPKLTFLDISFCSNINEDQCDQLRKLFSHIHIVFEEDE